MANEKESKLVTYITEEARKRNIDTKQVEKFLSNIESVKSKITNTTSENK